MTNHKHERGIMRSRRNIRKQNKEKKGGLLIFFITSLRFGMWQMTLAAHTKSVLDWYCLNFLTLLVLKKPLNTFTRLFFLE